MDSYGKCMHVWYETAQFQYKSIINSLVSDKRETNCCPSHIQLCMILSGKFDLQVKFPPQISTNLSFLTIMYIAFYSRVFIIDIHLCQKRNINRKGYTCCKLTSLSMSKKTKQHRTPLLLNVK